jgi:hypothetical protein
LAAVEARNEQLQHFLPTKSHTSPEMTLRLISKVFLQKLGKTEVNKDLPLEIRTVAHVLWLYVKMHQFESMHNAELLFQFLLTF